jgi:hypothetical protein
MQNRFIFQGGNTGEWRVTGLRAVAGEGLAAVPALAVHQGDAPDGAAAAWSLTGLVSNVRYATADEMVRLRATQQNPGRAEARCAALIPIRKSAAWWALAQDERRAIFEETSHHNAIGMDYLPPVARRLHHCRDIGEPFDFLTWFDFAPEHGAAFDELLVRLRATREWDYVEREVEIRLER